MSAYEFSGAGDITRKTGQDTTAGSRAQNAQAADTVNDVPEFGRAFGQAGSGGVVGDDDMINHAYGES